MSTSPIGGRSPSSSPEDREGIEAPVSCVFEQLAGTTSVYEDRLSPAGEGCHASTGPLCRVAWPCAGRPASPGGRPKSLRAIFPRPLVAVSSPNTRRGGHEGCRDNAQPHLRRHWPSSVPRWVRPVRASPPSGCRLGSSEHREAVAWKLGELSVLGARQAVAVDLAHPTPPCRPRAPIRCPGPLGPFWSIRPLPGGNASRCRFGTIELPAVAGLCGQSWADELGSRRRRHPMLA